MTRLPDRPLVFGTYPAGRSNDRVCRTKLIGAEHRVLVGHQVDAMLSVSTHVVGAVAFWLPGLQGTPCRSSRSEIPAGAARAIAVQINRAPPLPAGPMSCASDDGTAVWIYLRPAGTRAVQKVTLSPVGCLTVSAAGRWPRYLPASVMRTLAPYAPPGWTRYMSNGV